MRSVCPWLPPPVSFYGTSAYYRYTAGRLRPRSPRKASVRRWFDMLILRRAAGATFRPSTLHGHEPTIRRRCSSYPLAFSARAPRFRAVGSAAVAAAAAAAAATAVASGSSLPAAPRPCQSDPAPKRGRRVDDDYQMLDLLGEGAFAVVRSGQCRRTGKKVAIKVIPTTRQSAAAVRAEVSVLKQVSLHTCIAKFMDVYEHADEGKFYIVMEFVDGGDLLDKVCADGPWSEASAARLLSELGGAIALLHAQGLCHADVKPENVLLTAEGEVRDCARLCEIVRDCARLCENVLLTAEGEVRDCVRLCEIV